MRQHLPRNRAGDERPPDIAFAREELPLTVRDAATYLGISAQTVYLWVERKQIPHLRVMGRNIRFLKSDLAKPFLICSSVLLYLLRRLCLLFTLYSSSKNDGRKDESPSRSLMQARVKSQPSSVEFEMAYQVRVAIDRIRFAIKATDQFAHHPQQLQEAGLQLLDAFDRLESADRHFQIRFRKASVVERRGPLQNAPNGQVGNGSDGVGS